MDNIEYKTRGDGTTDIFVKGEYYGRYEIDDLSKMHIGDCIVHNAKGKPPGCAFGLCLVYVDDLSKPDITPPFKDGAKIKCIKRSIEIWPDGNTSENAFCIEDNIYTVDYCVWSSKCGWLVFIYNEFHLARDFELVND